MEYLSFLESNLKEILDAKENNKLVFFIGAGYSKFSETELLKIPSWGELIQELKEELGVVDEGDYLKIAQLYFLKFGQHSYVNKIKSSIRELEPSDYHKKIFELNPHYIITTNWDDLIEKTVKSMALPYDIISSDIDLAQSKLDKKIIKMHGDFKQHNFVFKEDDYLQYNKNFPLIENYIKGIFSTCTIVFLGYSYSDYNLKQIITWITNISKATPNKFLIQKDFSYAHAQYLNNHGISLLTPTTKKMTYENLYGCFFDDLNTIADRGALIIEMLKFSENNLNDKKLLKVINNKIIDYFEYKFRALKQYNVLLPEQITKKITNCTINFIPKVRLEFPDNLLTNDYDVYKRKINFIYNSLFLSGNDKCKASFDAILNKAFIDSVLISGKEYKILERTVNVSENILNKLTFKYSKNSLEIMMMNNNFKDVLSFYLSKVNFYLDESNFIMATINMANFDSVYQRVESHAKNVNDRHYSTCIILLNEFKCFNYKNRIKDFPNDLQSDLNELVDILEFKEIYKAYYRFSVETRKYRKYSDIRNNGGIAYSADEANIRAKLYPYIKFILGNDLFIENYIETKSLFEDTVMDSLNYNFSENYFKIQLVDVFILIKYCKHDVVKSFANKLLENKIIFEIIHMECKEIRYVKKYVLESLKNICLLFKDKDQSNIYSTFVDGCYKNIIIILSFIRWNEVELKNIIENILSVSYFRTQGTDLYDSIMYFISVNNYLYNRSNKIILNIIDIIVEKIIYEKINGYDNISLDIGILNNLYHVSTVHGYKYENVSLVKMLISKVENIEIRSKRFYTEKLLLNIRRIGNDEVRDEIDSFVKDEILNFSCEEPKDYIFKLVLISEGYCFPEVFISELENFIENIFSNDSLDAQLTKIKIQNDLSRYLKYLIEEKGLSQFQASFDKFTALSKS
ncbi:SIR2 family protein [Pantoea agglomerans]|uniref:SIR2 family protein n=1 Tax=Enterobacter agglomerans TaxID=549 RepID=UPI0039F67EBB|nr:hypothetical protein [Pantoea agglomerans]